MTVAHATNENDAIMIINDFSIKPSFVNTSSHQDKNVAFMSTFERSLRGGFVPSRCALSAVPISFEPGCGVVHGANAVSDETDLSS